jgi:hypothetical protein
MVVDRTQHFKKVFSICAHWNTTQYPNKYVYVMANVESRLELSQLNSTKFEARVESSPKTFKIQL